MGNILIQASAYFLGAESKVRAVILSQMSSFPTLGGALGTVSLPLRFFHSKGRERVWCSAAEADFLLGRPSIETAIRTDCYPFGVSYTEDELSLTMKSFAEPPKYMQEI